MEEEQVSTANLEPSWCTALFAETSVRPARFDKSLQERQRRAHSLHNSKHSKTNICISKDAEQEAREEALRLSMGLLFQPSKRVFALALRIFFFLVFLQTRLDSLL